MDLSFLDEDPPWVVMWDGKPRSIHATEEEAQGAVNLYLQDYYRRFQAIPAPLHPILQVGKDIGP
jgi:prolyl-tRNA synthetase